MCQDNEHNVQEVGSTEEKEPIDLRDVDYYTKTEVNNLLGYKTIKTSADFEVVEYLPNPSKPNWKITFHPCLSLDGLAGTDSNCSGIFLYGASELRSFIPTLGWSISI